MTSEAKNPPPLWRALTSLSYQAGARLRTAFGPDTRRNDSRDFRTRHRRTLLAGSRLRKSGLIPHMWYPYGFVARTYGVCQGRPARLLLPLAFPRGAVQRRRGSRPAPAASSPGSTGRFPRYRSPPWPGGTNRPLPCFLTPRSHTTGEDFYVLACAGGSMHGRGQASEISRPKCVVEENANDAKYHETSFERRRGRCGPCDRRAGLGATPPPPMAPSSPAPAAAAPAGAAAAAAAPMATTAPHKRMQVRHRVYHHAANRSYHHAYRYHAYHRARTGDIANQLNAQELARVGSSTAPGVTGSYGWGYDQGAGGYGQPSPTPGSGYGGGLMAPGTLGGGYGQPSPTQGIPGGNQPSASSHPRY
jgi:hypothetical protein